MKKIKDKIKNLTQDQKRIIIQVFVIVLMYFVASTFNFVMLSIFMEIPSENLDKLTVIDWTLGSFSLFILTSYWFLLMYGFYSLLGGLFNEWERYQYRKERKKNGPTE